MEGFGKISCVAAVAALCGVLCGCEDKPITIRYERPAEYDISQKIRRIAIAEFGGQSAADRKFGNIAADELASQLDVYNKKYSRYQLVDRKRLQAILDEQDMQLAVSDTQSATKIGKIADVQAIIYGTVTTSTKDERASRMSFSITSRMPKRVYYTKRYCMVSVNFTMDNITSSKTLATVTATQEYDSDKDKKGAGGQIGKTLGFSGDNLPPADQIMTRLISDCVEQFIRKISPHSVVVTEKMEKGKSKIVQTGNKLARSGDYAEALECYNRAIASQPNDDGAMFNIGLVYEAMGRFEESANCYTKAFSLKDKEKYVLARKRVRSEGDN